MSVITSALKVVETLPLPDPVSRAGVSFLVERTRRKLAHAERDIDRRFAQMMARLPIAEYTSEANEQHYELPAEFFALVLGPRRKYSCCLYLTPEATLAEAEDAALAQTAENAAIIDGQDILELGCGWGSLSLWMAEHYPNARITAVSNSHSQRLSIMSRAAARGFTNFNVVTADMNDFTTDRTFDRVVSVEMFEHMCNWQSLLGRIRGWLRPDGRLFLHVFSHRTAPYRFDHSDKTDWIAQHFFTGGVMPSHTLIRQFNDAFRIEADWRWNGRHYQRTATDWLANFDRHRGEIDEIMRGVYGKNAALWARRWRLFFLATEGLFGHADGEEWGVSHYRLAPV